MSQLGEPRWEVTEKDGVREVRLLGRWSVLPIARAGGELPQRMRAFEEPAACVWNLEQVERLDSAGALLLWELWGGRYPERLRLRDDQRPRFERLRELPERVPRRRARPAGPLIALGRRIEELFAETAGVVLLFAQLVADAAYCVRNPRAIPWKEISATIYRAGTQSLALLAFIGLLVGVVFSYQMVWPLQQLGVETRIIDAVGVGFLRELGPFLTALILVARSGSSITAGIGGMRLTEEVDALRAFGVSPTLRVVLPKVLGLGLATPLLVLWTDFNGVLGAIYISTTQLDIGYPMWLNRFPDAVGAANHFIGIGKGVLFGVLTGLISGYYGIHVARNTRSLTAHTTRAVVVGIALVIAIDGSLGVLFAVLGV